MHLGKTQIYLDMLLLISDLTGSFSEVIQDADWPSELVWWRVCVRADAQELSAVVRQRPPLPVLCQHRHSTLPAVETIRWQNVVRVHLIHVASILYTLRTIFIHPNMCCLLQAAHWHQFGGLHWRGAYRHRLGLPVGEVQAIRLAIGEVDD